MNQNKEKQNKIIHTATTYQNAKREIYWILNLAIQAFARYFVCEYSTVYTVKLYYKKGNVLCNNGIVLSEYNAV